MAERIQIRSGGVSVRVRLTPKGGRDAVEGWETDSAGASHLKARVRAAPESGKANAALIELIAKALDVSRSSVAITGGEKARLKTVAIAGDTSSLAAKLESFGAAT
jgi:uncharacterized protein YggU (UPF0235/DUF167 family)